ncbi:MAG: ABC transporter ATP-binding protein [Zetaproteobacteria bacterium]|nr:ABC transporter ATP-binding protein [Zetaproteobacteria bacterium]
MKPLLQVQNIRFRWPQTDTWILEVDLFKVAAGEHVFIHGPSGSGKSTLLKLIGGVLVPQQGDIFFLNTNLTQLSSEARDTLRGNHMGFIFQMFNLLPYFSALENVTLPCEFSTQKSARIFESKRSITEEATRLLTELKLDTKILAQKTISQLSVGQQQRVAAARALMGRPELIIADEPTSALDREVTGNFLDLLFAECHKSGTALIFVSHDRSLGAKFDRVVSLPDIQRTPHIHSEDPHDPA